MGSVRNIDYAEGLPKGWGPLFVQLVAEMEVIDPGVRIVQAKQELGGMRVDIERGCLAIHVLIATAEQASLTKCEECGADASMRRSPNGWWRTLCCEHAGDFVAADDAELIEQKRNRVRAKRRLVHLSGGLLDVEAVQAMMGYSTKQAVYKAAAEREMLAVDNDGRPGFPLCQFEDGRVLAGITAILKAAPNTTGWRILKYLYDQEDGLAGDRPIELIRRSQSDMDRAMRFARRLEQ